MAAAKLVERTRQANLKAALAEHLDEPDTAHDIGHVERVWANAKTIATQEQNGDLPILIGAAYLHDLVSLPKDHPERHTSSALSAKAAAPILANLGYARNQIEHIQHAITAHSYSAKIPPKTIEAKILQDADRLDALGAIGIARTFAVSGALGRPIYHTGDPFGQHRSLDDTGYAIDHWPLKLLRLPEMMQTNSGKSLAVKRINHMQGFLVQLASELGADIPEDWFA